MYPNPASALPLPPHPNLEQYKKQAKDLVRACRTGGPDSIRKWAAEWIEALIRLQAETITPESRALFERQREPVTDFARNKLTTTKLGRPKCALADAQFITFLHHQLLSRPGSIGGRGLRVSRWQTFRDCIRE